ncbi:polysaccharide biosynthesis protein [Irregularibacter muris]|uniref:Polysaccharide biosynthesis protein n=1 Tax=Irregularibacter muris TaxID=1796619 RepID=A0AAE3HG85_9FIRM|nr:nucleoside-diphosphate sugar epimerase/dehydratase [Irregularibacter muris]MCR1900066.1 polysaccharide biosynthesis protein [Irregularibacter muris]
MKSVKRKSILILSDIFFVNLSVVLSLLLILPVEQFKTQFLNYLPIAIFTIAIRIIIYYLSGLYSSLWRYASIDELLNVVMAVTLGSIGSYFFARLGSYHSLIQIHTIIWMLNIFFIGGSRFAYRILRRLKFKVYKYASQRKNVLVYGAGDAGSIVIKELETHRELDTNIVAMIDDDPAKFRRRINGVPVVGGKDKLMEAVKKYDVEEIIIALPSANRKRIKEIIELCNQTGCKLKTLPGVYELIDGKVDIKNIRDVEIEDLLGRDPITLNNKEINDYIKGKVVLVTGGGGSIGSELCRQIATFGPQKLIIFDIYENNAYDLQLELKKKYPNLDLSVLIGSVRDKARVNNIFEIYKPHVVFHAAAHKHVPLMEDSPAEAIKNNVFGTINVAEAANQYKSNKFVLISTDKAVNPTNIMGTTKRIAEITIQIMNKQSDTEYVAVRFGNVLGSNGSVIPVFRKQIAAGGPVTVTHPDIIRYFMTIPEASQLVLQAGGMARGGEIFILDMGDPVKIVDLARDLIRLSGFIPDEDIKIEFTGLRPGEKLYEELLTAEEGLVATKHAKILISQPISHNAIEFMKELEKLKGVLSKSGEEIAQVMKEIVPSFSRVG